MSSRPRNCNRASGYAASALTPTTSTVAITAMMTLLPIMRQKSPEAITFV